MFSKTLDLLFWFADFSNLLSSKTTFFNLLISVSVASLLPVEDFARGCSIVSFLASELWQAKHSIFLIVIDLDIQNLHSEPLLAGFFSSGDNQQAGIIERLRPKYITNLFLRPGSWCPQIAKSVHKMDISRGSIPYIFKTICFTPPRKLSIENSSLRTFFCENYFLFSSC